jgi:tRNA(Ile)-lysidine synthetase-like protein
VLQSLERHLRQHRLVRPGERVGVAVSGGADSVALLRALDELAPSLGLVLFVLHLDHRLRGPDSDADAHFVAELAARLGLACAIESEDVGSLAALLHLSLEAAGRRARYAFFQRQAVAHRLDCVATAHTRDDQAETVLLRLLRGSGTSGLAGIHRSFDLSQLGATDPPAGGTATGREAAGGPHPPAVGECGDPSSLAPESPTQNETRPTRLIRPLLSTTRQQVEQYLLSLGQPFRSDASNLSPQFLRNRVRRELLPGLERDYNPRLREALCETAEIAAAESAFLDELVSAALGPGANLERGVELKLLQAPPLALQRRILRRLCHPHGLALDFAQLEAFREFALAGRAGRLNLPRGFAAEVVREKFLPPRLCLLPPGQQRPPAPYCFELAVPGELSLAGFWNGPDIHIHASLLDEPAAAQTYNCALLSAERVGARLTVRNLRPGDRFQPLHSSGEGKVNRLLQELSIPAALRRSWPVVLAGNCIVWIPGLPVAGNLAWSPGDGQAVVLEMRGPEIERRGAR